MAEVEAASAAPGEKRSAGRPRKEAAPPAAPALLKAAESGDPAVQYLIAVRTTAVQNKDKVHEDWATAELAKLGFG
jgi:hypothetical protein